MVELGQPLLTWLDPLRTRQWTAHLRLERLCQPAHMTVTETVWMTQMLKR